jgi:hypothetical protein
MTLKEIESATPVATLTAIPIVITGCVIAVLHPDVLSFSELCQDAGIVLGGAGVLGLSRSALGKGK